MKERYIYKKHQYIDILTWIGKSKVQALKISGVDREGEGRTARFFHVGNVVKKGGEVNDGVVSSIDVKMGKELRCHFEDYNEVKERDVLEVGECYWREVGCEFEVGDETQAFEYRYYIQKFLGVSKLYHHYGEQIYDIISGCVVGEGKRLLHL